MPTLRTRASKGTDLTPTEADTNFKRTVSQKTTTYSCLVSDNRSMIECSSSTPFTVTLGDAATMAAAETGDYEVTINNIGSGAVTVARAGSNTINGASTSITLAQYSGVTLKVISAGTGYVSVATPLPGITATAAELNILDGATLSTAELNILDGVTASAAELNIMDGVTSSAAELNILDGVTASAAELNIMDGVTASTAEINKIDGYTGSTADLNVLSGCVTSGVTAARIQALNDFLTASGSVQGQLNGKLATSGGTDLAVADGGTGASTAASARSNLGITELVTSTSLIQGGNAASELLRTSTSYGDYTADEYVNIPAEATTLAFVGRLKGNATGPTTARLRLVVSGTPTAAIATEAGASYAVTSEATYNISALSGWTAIKWDLSGDLANEVGCTNVSWRIY